MKHNVILLLSLLLRLISSYDEKGKYDNSENDHLTITGNPEDLKTP